MEHQQVQHRRDLDRVDAIVALAKVRHARAFLVIGLLVAALFVERQITWEEHHLPGRPKHGLAGAVT